MKIVKGRQAAAFDIPEDFVNDLEFTLAELNSSVVVEKATEVVEFDEGNQAPTYDNRSQNHQ